MDVAFPAEWDGGSALLLRFAARLTLTGDTTWDPSSTTSVDTADDPDAVLSTLEAAFDTISADSTSGATMTGSPSASAYFALAIAAFDGSDYTAASSSGGASVTGHDYFPIADHAYDTLHVQVVVSATAVTITDAAGFDWTLVEQVAVGAAWLTVWTAPIPANSGAQTVYLNGMCDAGIGRQYNGTVA